VENTNGNETIAKQLKSTKVQRF